jgi:uncharacterized membrane protein
VPDLQVQLGSLAGGSSGLFAEVIAPGANAASALGVGVNALDLLYSAIGVATQKHAVAVNGLSLAGLVSAKTVLIEPPSVAIGGVGATAYTAQLRSWIEVDTGNLPVIGHIARVKLPIMVDLVNGRGANRTARSARPLQSPPPSPRSAWAAPARTRRMKTRSSPPPPAATRAWPTRTCCA